MSCGCLLGAAGAPVRQEHPSRAAHTTQGLMAKIVVHHQDLFLAGHPPASRNLAAASSTSGFQSRPPAARRMECSYLALPCCSQIKERTGRVA
jgi:hypothetical protein